MNQTERKGKRVCRFRFQRWTSSLSLSSEFMVLPEMNLQKKKQILTKHLTILLPFQDITQNVYSAVVTLILVPAWYFKLHRKREFVRPQWWASEDCTGCCWLQSWKNWPFCQADFKVTKRVLSSPSKSFEDLCSVSAYRPQLLHRFIVYIQPRKWGHKPLHVYSGSRH